MARTDGRTFRLFDRPHVVFLAVAFGVSWTIWLVAWWLARTVGDGTIQFNETLVAPLVDGGAAGRYADAVSWFAVLAVYGPLIGSLVAARVDPDFAWKDLWARALRVRVGARWYGAILAILAVTAGSAALLVAVTTQRSPDAPADAQLMAFLGLFFVYQLATSATEEFGWRGYLNEKLRHGRDFWDVGWAVGLPWAAWHLPVVTIMFVQQGLPPAALLGSLAGFGIGIVAMAILHAWFYQHTRSVFLSILIHALFNTLPLTTALLYVASPAAAVANVALWAVVVVLRVRQQRARRAAAPPTA